jgi:hypothetical protein
LFAMCVAVKMISLEMCATRLWLTFSMYRSCQIFGWMLSNFPSIGGSQIERVSLKFRLSSSLFRCRNAMLSESEHRRRWSLDFPHRFKLVFQCVVSDFRERSTAFEGTI